MTIVVVVAVIWVVAAVLFALLIGAVLRKISHDDAVRDRDRRAGRDRIKKAG